MFCNVLFETSNKMNTPNGVSTKKIQDKLLLLVVYYTHPNIELE